MTQAVLVEGKNRIRIHERHRVPGGSFAPVEPTLEDAYLVLMRTGELAGVPTPTAVPSGALS